MSLMARAGITIGAFVLLFASGYRLAYLGKPYGFLLFNIHKIVALGLVVLLSVTALGARKVTDVSAGSWVAFGLAILGFLVLFGTGGAMSAMESAPDLVHVAHRVAPYFATLLFAVAFYFLLRTST